MIQRFYRKARRRARRKRIREALLRFWDRNKESLGDGVGAFVAASPNKVDDLIYNLVKIVISSRKTRLKMQKDEVDREVMEVLETATRMHLTFN